MTDAPLFPFLLGTLVAVMYNTIVYLKEWHTVHSASETLHGEKRCQHTAEPDVAGCGALRSAERRTTCAMTPTFGRQDDPHSRVRRDHLLLFSTV